jgi:hypothetical protein
MKVKRTRQSTMGALHTQIPGVKPTQGKYERPLQSSLGTAAYSNPGMPESNAYSYQATHDLGGESKSHDTFSWGIAKVL